MSVQVDLINGNCVVATTHIILALMNASIIAHFKKILLFVAFNCIFCMISGIFLLLF